MRYYRIFDVASGKSLGVHQGASERAGILSYLSSVGYATRSDIVDYWGIPWIGTDDGFKTELFARYRAEDLSKIGICPTEGPYA
jgi:hypothetical protein